MALGAFHIHVNALALDIQGQQLLEQLGFEVRNFQTGPLGSTNFVPRVHLTNHQSSSMQFKSLFRQARGILANRQEFVGYMEGEHLSRECRLEIGPATGIVLPEARSPFIILFEGARKWREAELHVSVAEKDATPWLTEYFLRLGFYSARLPKRDGTYVVFTVQGYYKVIRAIFERIQADLAFSSDSAVVRVKLERSAGYYVSPAFNWLPMQAYAILDCSVEAPR